jgi:hypothetical protein
MKKLIAFDGQSSPFERVSKVETLRSHGQSLLWGESAQGHVGSVMVGHQA